MVYKGRDDGALSIHDRVFKRVIISACDVPLSEQIAISKYEANNAKLSPDDYVIGLIGYACDLGVARNLGRIGASKGPSAIRSQLANLAITDQIIIKDYGDITFKDEFAHEIDASEHKLLESADNVLEAVASYILSQNEFLLTLGGGHESSLAPIKALISKLNNGTKLGVINFDAHLDIREQEFHTSGNSFNLAYKHAKSLGIELNYLCIGTSLQANTQALWNELDAMNGKHISDEDFELNKLEILEEFLEQNDVIYLSIDMDAFSNLLGVSAPAAIGINLAKASSAINKIAKSSKLVAADICELNPKYDESNLSAKAASVLAARIIESAKKYHKK